MNRVVIVLIALSTACGIARPNDAEPSQQISQQQALENARSEIANYHPLVIMPLLRSYEAVDLDQTTWGKSYWAFRFTGLKENSVYYVNKQSGFVQSVVTAKAIGQPHVVVSDLKASPTVGDLDFWKLTLRKRPIGEAYLITVVIDSPTAATTCHSLLVDLREGGDRPHPKYYYQERKEIACIQDVQNVRTATFIVRKHDLEKYDYVSAIISWHDRTSGAGRAWSYRIGEIPDE